MNFMFEWQEQYLTSERSKRVRYCSWFISYHIISIHIFELTCNCSFYYINILMTAFLMIFGRFPTTFRRFSKIFQNCSEGQTNVPEHFPRISENFRRCQKIAEDFRGRPEDVSMIHQRQTWYQWNHRYLRMWRYRIIFSSFLPLGIPLTFI